MNLQTGQWKPKRTYLISLPVWAISALTLLLAACMVGQEPATSEPPQQIDELEDTLMPTPENEKTEDFGKLPDKSDDQPEPTSVSREIRLTPVSTPVKAPEKVEQLDDTKPIIGEVPEEILTAVTQEVMEIAGVKLDETTLVRAEAVIWPDGALGCPQPDVVYTQAQVPGYWIVLEVDGQTYDYRVNEIGYYFLCEQQLPKPLPPLIGGTPDA